MPSTCFELREQLHYLFFPCSPIGSPSWCLFLHYDTAVHPYATTTVLRFDAAVAHTTEKRYFGRMLQAKGTTALLVPSVQSCWVAFMVFVSML